MKLKLLFFILLITSFQSQAQVITIEEARALPEGTTVTVTGTATNGDEMGIIRYFEDGTAGIAAYGAILSPINRHDSITIEGVLKDYNGLLELDPVNSVENHGPANLTVEPLLTTPSGINEANEGRLLQFEGVVFTDGGGTFGNSTYQFTGNGEEGLIYLRSGHELIGEIIPVGPVTLIGLSSQFTFDGVGGYQLIPRDANDLINNNVISIVSPTVESNQTTSSYTLTWYTDVPASTGVRYSTDEQALDDDMTLVYVDEMVTEHMITLEDLESGQVYFNRAFSVTGTDTAKAGNAAVVTVSESSGTIKTYFNKEVDHSVAVPEDNLAIVANAIDDTIAAYIDKADVTLDIAVYNFNNTAIADAINAAYDRGVTIRMIVEGGNANVGLNYIYNSIPVLQRQFATGSGMHNKFMIIDAENTANAWIMGGATNFTDYNMSVDFNNVVFIQDQALARAYRVEFNEMWGSADAEPDTEKSKFGEEKKNNTPHRFVVGGHNLEMYFSPSDGTTSQIVNTIMSADASVYFATLVFTRDDIADAVIDRSNDFFVNVAGMIDQINTTGSEYEYLLDNFVQVYSYDQVPGALHHKYVIVDVNEPDDDPMVLTGSHNWSSSAENTNDENTLIIHDPLVVNQFYQEYNQRYLTIVGVEEENGLEALTTYPNPVVDRLNVTGFEQVDDLMFIVTDATGKIVYQKEDQVYPGEIHTIDLENYPAGIYFLQLIQQKNTIIHSFIKR